MSECILEHWVDLRVEPAHILEREAVLRLRDSKEWIVDLQAWEAGWEAATDIVNIQPALELFLGQNLVTIEVKYVVKLLACLLEHLPALAVVPARPAQGEEYLAQCLRICL